LRGCSKPLAPAMTGAFKEGEPQKRDGLITIAL
jgi:hypothetical protein